MNKHPAFLAASVTALLTTCSIAIAQPEYDFILVNSFNTNPNAGEAFIWGISDTGVACGVATMDNRIGYPAFVWTEATGKTELPLSGPQDVNTSGLVVGNGSVYNLATSQWITPPTLPGTYFGPSFAAVNESGLAVGSISTCTCSDSAGIQKIPYIWDAEGGARTLNIPSAKSLYRINNAGVALGWMNDLVSAGPFVVDVNRGSYTMLIDLMPAGFGQGMPQAVDVNNLGEIVGARAGTYPINRYGYVYSPTNGLTILPFPGAGFQQDVAPAAINDAGTVVGTIVTTIASRHLFVYTAATGMRDLSGNTALIAGLPAGYQFYAPTAINNQGWIVGYGFTASGHGTGFVLKKRGPVCDAIDFNHDGLFPDTQDIDDFLAVFAGGPCPTGACGDIDFNNDGLFPDTADIDSLLRVFSGGAC